MYQLLSLLDQSEGIRLEPSALAGMPGISRVLSNEEYLSRMGFTPEQLEHATHLVWATGGGMVPPEEMAKYLAKGQEQA